jgi:hypothetical protein
VSLPALAILSIATLTPMMGASDVGVTFRPEVTFSRAVNPATLTSSSFYATDSTGAVVPATIVPTTDSSGNVNGAWLLFTNQLPGASTITLHVEGDHIQGTDGSLLDAAGTGTPGSDLTETFTTVSTAPAPNTTISGIVVDPGPDDTPMTCRSRRSRHLPRAGQDLRQARHPLLGLPRHKARCPRRSHHPAASPIDPRPSPPALTATTFCPGYHTIA